MDIASIERHARRLGYRLSPISATALLTQRQVGDGYDTSRRLAGKNGLKHTAACERLKAAERSGLVVRISEPGTTELRYLVAEDA